MSKRVWNPGKTRDVQECDGYEVVVQKCAGYGMRAQRCGVSFCIQEKWRRIPAKFWAWTFVVRRQGDWLKPIGTWPSNGLGFWVPKLLSPIDDPTLWDQFSGELLPPQSTPSYIDCGCRAYRQSLRGTNLPPELFKRICSYADGRSGSFRLVSRYWEQQCRPHVFAGITLCRSPQRLGPFLTLTRDVNCRFMPLVKSLSVPHYTAQSNFPFLHLLGQTGIPADGPVRVEGPFRKGHRTIRSIHFAVPRTLPSSFSRGLIDVDLKGIHFERFEDLTSLASELRDLEKLGCRYVTFGSFPTALPRRRPRKSFNKLNQARLMLTESYAEQSKHRSWGMHAPLFLFLSVHSSTALFNEGEAAVLFALLKLMRTTSSEWSAEYNDYPENNSRLFEISGFTPLIALRTRLDLSRNNSVSGAPIVYLHAEYCLTDTACWSELDAACRSLSQPPQFVIAAWDHTNLLEFAANMVKKMPSLFRPGAVRYSLKNVTNGSWMWYLASLDSEKLEGQGHMILTDVYP